MEPFDPRNRLTLGAALAAIGLAAAADESRPADAPLETVTVTGVAPLPFAGVPASLIAADVQAANATAIASSLSLDLTQFMNRTAASLTINEAQANPLQPDVQFRGFTASPLLGLPQGLAVYQDGVRINEPFGDVVNWVLLPQAGVATLTLTPGAHPVFGMNALGGAVSLRMKNGAEHGGLRMQAAHGDFDRTTADLEYGAGEVEGWSYFAVASHLDERGWRDASPSRALQTYGDVRYGTRDGFIALSATAVDAELIGNGPAPVQLLAEDRAAVFTSPDQTHNDLLMLTLHGRLALSERVQLSALAFERRSDADSLNGDDSPYELCEGAAQILCEEDGEFLVDTSGRPIPAVDALSEATVNRSATRQRGRGAAVQLHASRLVFERPNHLTFGAAVDRSAIGFVSSTEVGALDEGRRAVGGGVYPTESLVRLDADTKNLGVYFTNTLELTPRLSVNVAGRFDRVEVQLRDRLGEALNGEHRFSRFNPALGFTWRLSEAVQLYGHAGEAARAPSPAELTCADEDDPCRLPNAFLSDPPLEQVVNRSLEAGLRGAAARLRWRVGAFHSVNRDDILFISAGALTNAGYFDNVGRTRRRGLELAVAGEALGERISWYANYTRLDATFREAFRVASAHNPAAVNGEIAVEPGDRLPGIAKHVAKLGVEAALLARWTLGVDLNYASSQTLRGDEGNLTPPLGGYAVVNARVAFEAGRRFTLFASIDNVFDRRYASFGLFGEPDEVLGDDYDDPRFVSPGAPRAAWLGVRLSL